MRLPILNRLAPNSWLARTAPFAVFLAQVLLFYRHILFWRRYSIPFDIQGYHHPLAFFASESLGLHRLPLWDPHVYCGFPFYANINSQLFYPFAWPFFALANVLGLEALPKLLEWETALHIALAGIFAYLLLRRIGLARGPAVLGGTIYQLGGYFSSQTQHLGAVCGAAWLPLAWYAAVSLAGRFTWRALAGLSAALAMTVLAGYPATAIVVFGSTLLLGVLLVAFRRGSPLLLAAILGACCWAALIAAVQLLPTLNQIPESSASLRAQYRSVGGLPYQALVSLVSPNYYRIFNPEEYSFPFNLTFMYLYCSIAGLLLAALAVFLSRHKLTLAFVLLTACCCVWMLGSNTPVIGAYYGQIPAFIRGPMYPEFAMAAFVLGMAVLAALGAERFFRNRPVLVAALIVIAAIDLTAYGSRRVMNTGRNDPAQLVTPRAFEGSGGAVRTMRGLTGQDFPPSRFDLIQGSHNWASSPQVIHLYTAGGDEPLAPLRILKLRQCIGEGSDWERYFQASRVESPVLDLMNVRYLVKGGPRQEVESPHLKRVASAARHSVYENPDYLPRFFLAGHVRRVRDFSESLAAVCSPSFDPRREAVVEGEGELAAPPSPKEATVRAITYEPDFVELEATSPTPAFLVTSEAWHAGWRAEVNGRSEPLRITNGAFRGLRVPAGHSRILMKFEPADFRHGLLGTALGLAALAIAVAPRRRLRRPARPTSSPSPPVS